MAKIWHYLKTHGFLIMMVGFAISAVSLIVYVSGHRDHSSFVRQVSFATTIVGFCICVGGRILYSMQRKSQKQQKPDLV
ncbi:MAG: hypothetical protein PHC61_09950 [Chitinivibrionales bacterium]|nr:hypothetical protein [Chitinivibrionales bacterium]